MADTGELHIHVGSIYGHKAKEPFVELKIGESPLLQLTPAKAREIAGFLIESAEAAEQDAFLVEWARQAIGADDAVSAALLSEYRAWRANRGKGPHHDYPEV